MVLRSVGDVVSFVGINKLIYHGEIINARNNDYKVKLRGGFYPYKNIIWINEKDVIKNNANKIVNLIKKYSIKATQNIDALYNEYVEIVEDLWGCI